CFAYRIIARSPFTNTLKVQLTIAKTETVERALAAARADGLSPRLVMAPPPEAVSVAAIGAPAILWQAQSGAGETVGRRRLRHGLAIAAVLLSLFAYGLYVHRLDQIRNDLRARVDRDRPVAASVQLLAQQIGQTADELAFFRDRRRDPPPLAVLDALTALVPLDSWVRQLVVRGRTVEINGFSPRATDLIARAEASAMFANPQFRAPITLSSDGKSERFDLSLEIKKGAAR
ncbi:MAG TPA: PilN domain-containing protein, partial [Stellaceae bacterium]|nr:PilN domain-containing protein [Stellaceae bacterium]